MQKSFREIGNNAVCIREV